MCLCILDIRDGLAGGREQSMLDTCTQVVHVKGRDCSEKELGDFGSSMALLSPKMTVVGPQS